MRFLRIRDLRSRTGIKMKAFCLMLAAVCSVSMALPAFAARSKTQIQSEQAESKKKLDRAEDEAETIAEDKKAAEEEAAKSQEELVRILANVDIIEGEIEEKTKAADAAKQQYDTAKKKEDDQYEAMRLRIRYLYEHGGSTNPYLQLFTDPDHFAEALNKAGFTEEIYRYDRKLLESFQRTKEEVRESERRLKNELEELTEVRDTYEEESEELQKTIEKQRKEVENFSEKLSAAREEAASYRKEIEKQNAEIQAIAEAEKKALEEKKTAEAAALAKKKAELEAKKKAEEEARKKAEAAAKAAQEAKEKAEKEREKAEKEAAEKEKAEKEKEIQKEEEEHYADEDAGDPEAEKAAAEAAEAAAKAAEEAEKAAREAEEAAKAAEKKSSGGSAKGSEVAAFAQQFLGNPYVLGGTSLTNGCDCSGFTFSVYAHFGYSIPRTSWEQQSAGRAVSYAEAQPGDIICYAGHVGIYVGNGTICHASTPESGIKLTTATYRSILTIRRII